MPPTVSLTSELLWKVFRVVLPWHSLIEADEECVRTVVLDMSVALVVKIASY